METKASERMSHVAEQSALLEKAIEAITVEVEELESRLDNILTPDIIKEGKAGVPEANLVPYANFLRTQVERLEEIGGRLRNLRSRIEL